ncbi:MAG TPA: hypothetical protein VFB45_15805 [Pseudolabrys sp.]|nr:hypothetical protein [Pseudolabrys sp.]
MPRFPLAVAATIFSIALYFTLFWGFDALHVLTSPLHGLEQPWGSQSVYWIGRSIGLSPLGLLNLAIIFGAFKLTVAGVCLVHVLDRFRTLNSGKPNPEILEMGLLLVVIASIIGVMPAVWEHNADLIRTSTINLVLAAIAAALNALEHPEASEQVEAGAEVASEAIEEDPFVTAKPRATWYSPWR